MVGWGSNGHEIIYIDQGVTSSYHVYLHALLVSLRTDLVSRREAFHDSIKYGVSAAGNFLLDRSNEVQLGGTNQKL